MVKKDSMLRINQMKIVFLPGKGSSERCEKGKKGKSQVIFRLYPSNHRHA